MKSRGLFAPLEERLYELLHEDRIDFSTYREFCDFVYDVLVDFYETILNVEDSKE